MIHINPKKCPNTKVKLANIFVNWLMDIKKHKYFNKFNYYLTGGFMAWPDKTKDIDIIITTVTSVSCGKSSNLCLLH